MERNSTPLGSERTEQSTEAQDSARYRMLQSLPYPEACRLMQYLKPDCDRQLDAMIRAAEIVDCPRCGGLWYTDPEPGSNLPYTCFCCGNGTRRFTRAEVEDWDEGSRMARSELAGLLGQDG